MDEYENHPTQKPIALLERIIKASSKVGDVVLDPFSGTFTTSYVAKTLGRQSIGIELQEEYIKIGLRRLELATEYKGQTKEKPFRHELKYVIGEPEKALLTERFKHLIQLDKHATNGGYTIRSLYFDDYWNSAYAEKDAGILVRKKYRIRIYNFGTNSIKLERKKKVDTYILKEDAPLTVEEFYKIIDGDYDFLLKSPYPLCQEFYYECVSNMLRPRTIVDYEREPWVYDFGTVRLTFDQNVRVAVWKF